MGRRRHPGRTGTTNPGTVQGVRHMTHWEGGGSMGSVDKWYEGGGTLYKSVMCTVQLRWAQRGEGMLALAPRQKNTHTTGALLLGAGSVAQCESLPAQQDGAYTAQSSQPGHRTAQPPLPHGVHTSSYLRDQVRSQLRRRSETVLQGQLQQAVRSRSGHEQPPQRLRSNSRGKAPGAGGRGREVK